jgi:hypothetical protein
VQESYPYALKYIENNDITLTDKEKIIINFSQEVLVYYLSKFGVTEDIMVVIQMK